MSAFFQYLNQAAEPITEAAYVLHSMQSALASAERIYGMLDKLEMSKDPQTPAEVKHAKGLV